MARTIQHIMQLASQSTKPPRIREDDIPEADLFDRDFDEREEIKDQYENLFDIRTTGNRNIAGAFIGDSKVDWDDVKTGLEFETSNDSMFPDMIRAMTDPDSARPTQSRETYQSLSKLNVSKPIDLSANMRLSAQSSMNYRTSEVSLDGVGAENNDTYILDLLKKAAIFGLSEARTTAKKIAAPGKPQPVVA